MARHSYCDGVKRRDFLRAGVLGGTGLSLASYLQLTELGAVELSVSGSFGTHATSVELASTISEGRIRETTCE